jgi:hypothetical protein
VHIFIYFNFFPVFVHHCRHRVVAGIASSYRRHVTHSLTRPLSYSLTHSLTHSLPHSLSLANSHSLTHSLSQPLSLTNLPLAGDCCAQIRFSETRRRARCVVGIAPSSVLKCSFQKGVVGHAEPSAVLKYSFRTRVVGHAVSSASRLLLCSNALLRNASSGPPCRQHRAF